jgi:hypothetical protein
VTFRPVGRFRLTLRTITVAVAAVIVILLAFIGTTGSLTGAVTVSKAWSAAGISVWIRPE